MKKLSPWIEREFLFHESYSNIEITYLITFALALVPSV